MILGRIKMRELPILKPGDNVEVIAPASRCSDKRITEIRTLLNSWQLNCIIDENMFGADLLCANTDEARLHFLKAALLKPETKAVICARGGYGSMRLIPELHKVTKPEQNKLFIGMSDITALNLYLLQQWHWPVLHGALAVDKFSPESIAAIKALLFADNNKIEFMGRPCNKQAELCQVLESTITGGNLSMVQASIGTTWQIDGHQKVIFLEEISERAYRVDRMLEHLQQTGLFNNAAAIIFGDFLKGEEPDGSSLIQPILERFAMQCSIPVIQIAGIGHGHTSYPLPLGTKVQLLLGDKIKLICPR